MSYKIAEYPQSKYSFRLYDNTRRLTWKQIQAETGCYGIVNLAYFSLVNFSHQSAIMFGGKWGLKPKYHEYGILIDESGRLSVGTEDKAVYDYAIGCPPVDINGKRYTDKDGGKNGWTYTGVKADGTVVVLLCSKDTPETTDVLEAAMRSRGCIHILRWDGSWSSQGTLGPGMDVTPGQKRICRSWLLIFKKDGAETPPDKEDNKVKKVCLDPGHGPGNSNKSPDGSYFEYEFCYDVASQVRDLLKERDVDVIMTRDINGYPSLSDRCKISNNANADCFVSIHTNAHSGSGWGTARGLEMYTSQGPMNAARNVLATDLVNALHAAGVILRSEPIKFNGYDVLVGTNAPAVLVEYGFHTNKEDTALLKDPAYRKRISEATAKGICEFLGVKWEVENPVEDVNKPDSWAEKDWNWAKENGIMDGTRPRDTITRQEVAAIAKRLHEMK